jgi:redox-sensitive bicupin YhaK (pirin superfamily)
MPKKYEGLMQGFQLWVNLPAKKKMMEPRYRGITKDNIASFEKEGVNVKVIAGKIDDTKGPVRDLVVNVEYFDVELEAGKKFEHRTDKGWTAFAYVIDGSAHSGETAVKPEYCALFGDGDIVRIRTTEGAHFLFVAGKPLNEPIAWRGPIVMNTEAELALAFRELEEGSFIKATTRKRVPEKTRTKSCA